jgi:hypothetical protein|tara:strand:+ start:2738 stop:3490 length:753 start_codon:yes stop_codon:yes gene_type:complete
MDKYTASEWAAMDGGHTIEPKQKMFGFMNDELVEARLFRNPTQFATSNKEDIAKNVYAHLMGVQAMRYTDPGQASTYARKTMSYNGFDGVRTGATDLHNLIAGLERKGGYSIPTAQIKRYLKNVQNGVVDTQLDRRTMLAVERSLQIRDPKLTAMRRIISDWPRALPNEQKAGATRLGFMLNHYARGSDLAGPYNKSVTGIVSQDAKSPYTGNTFAKTIAGVAVGAVIGYKAIRDKNIQNVHKKYKIKKA